MGKSNSKATFGIERDLDETSINAHKELLKDKRTDIKPIEITFPTLQKALVHGQDRRKRIEPSNIKSMPYSAVLRIEIQFNNTLYCGTASLIGPSYALTAAHNVFRGNQNNIEWASSIRVIPAQCEDDEPFGDTYVHRVFKFDGCDIALLILQDSFTNGYFELGAIEKEADLKNKILTIAGYPVTNENKRSMYSHEGPCQEFRKSQITEESDGQRQRRESTLDEGVFIHYDIDTSKGQSGAPVWMEVDGKYMLVGVHSGCAGKDKSTNLGVPLLRKRVEEIKKWMELLPGMGIKSGAGWKQNELRVVSSRDKLKISSAEKEDQVIERVEKKRTTIEDRDLVCVAEAFKNRVATTNKTYKSLKLNLDSCIKVTEKGVCALLENFSKLNTLEITLSRCGKITAQGMSQLIATIGRTMKNLKNLTLTFRGCYQVEDRALEGLSQYIGMLGGANNSLLTLTLDFDRCEKIGDQGLSALMNQIAATQKNIQQLTLSFGECIKISDDSITSIAESIKTSLINLKYLRLDFWRCWQITDLGILELGNQIINKSSTLQTLRFDFTRCLQVSESARNHLDTCVKVIPQHKVLWVN